MGEGAYTSEYDTFYDSRTGIHICLDCAASFNDDNSFAEHLGRHRRIARGDGSESDRMTNERQAARARADDLRGLLAELRG